MRMIPATPHGTHSPAEKRVFDLLRAAFTVLPSNHAGEREESLTAYHSLNLPGHAYKRFGEIDFLICGLPGIFVLEVKGGRIACRDGIWRFADRYGEVRESAEGPFRQAESALHALMANLRANLPAAVVSSFTIGYGVIFPDCEWTVKGAEWAPPVLADGRAVRDLEGWLRRFFRHWRDREAGVRGLEARGLAGEASVPPGDAARRRGECAAAALADLQRYLRPEFETATPLSVEADRVEERVVALTEDQMAMVDVVDANPRVLCSGGAGTGKTFLALELARRWCAEGMAVALACRSPWLRRYLESRLSLPNLTTTLADSIGTACRRAGLEKFGALIVDEGQDLFDMEILGKLDASLDRGLRRGRWAIFHDVNNQSGLFGPPDREALDCLLGMGAAIVPLRTNCRNTRLILEKVQTSLGADMGVRGVGEGPEVRELRVESRRAAAEALAREIRAIVDEGGVYSGNLTILSARPYRDSSVALLPESLRRDITILDEYALRHTPFGRITFAEASSFKGLENEAIIVVDLPPPVPGDGRQALRYVAMSRPRAILSLIYREG